MSLGLGLRRQGSKSVSALDGVIVRGVCKSLRGRSILRDVELTVPRGTVAVVEGENGTGKTTLVRILSTVVLPDTGVALVNGFDVSSQGMDVRRSIGVSFANERSLYWRINAVQNLQLFGRIAGLPKRVIAERSSTLLEELHLQSASDRWVAQMSTGQRQRLMVARALLTDPAVLLLDEPFRGLDEQGLKALLSLVARRKLEGTTTLIVAPLIEAVLPLADSIYRMEGGRILTREMGQLDERHEDQT
jgi:ABC-type multidrug transport system ATPase subunit